MNTTNLFQKEKQCELVVVSISSCTRELLYLTKKLIYRARSLLSRFTMLKLIIFLFNQGHSCVWSLHDDRLENSLKYLSIILSPYRLEIEVDLEFCFN